MWDIDGQLVAALYDAIVDEAALEQPIDAIARRLRARIARTVGWAYVAVHVAFSAAARLCCLAIHQCGL
jgi:hypothetical protein